MLLYFMYCTVIVVLFLQISFCMSLHKAPIICINFENVPIEKLDAELIPSKLVDIFERLMHDDCYFDLEKMRANIGRYKFISMSNIDLHPHESLALIIITDFLYGNNEIDVSNIIYD